MYILASLITLGTFAELQRKVRKHLMVWEESAVEPQARCVCFQTDLYTLIKVKAVDDFHPDLCTTNTSTLRTMKWDS